MTVRCIDNETTGVDPARDAIVEIASVDLQRDGAITKQQAALVCPGMPIPAEASAVHHLIDSDLAAAPQLEQLIQRFKGADAYVAHNCSFEQLVSKPASGGDDLGVYLQMRAARLAGSCLAWQPGVALPLRLINPFGIDRTTLVPHRALSDAVVTAAIFFEITKHARWPELVQWSAEPALMTFLRFGMHRRERFDAVPEDYLRWIVEGNHDLSDDVMFSARYWLGRRPQPDPATGNVASP